MKKLFILPMILIMGTSSVFAQDYDLILSGSESGNQTHIARNSITFGTGYNYTPSGGAMSAAIENKVISGDVVYNAITDPGTRNLNTSYVVGTTQGSFSVNPAGAATYSIPISLPNGVSGHQPSLALVYNSMAGPGVSGYGWSISGMSAITRAPQNYYNDNAATGIELTSTDRFSIDGQRFVCTSGSYGVSGSQYHTENDNFSRVTCYSDYGDSPTSFFAETKDGIKIQYGYTSDSKQTVLEGSKILSWYVNKVTDIYGNEINYKYFQDNGAVYIAQIKYGSYIVDFFYDNRADAITSYIKGSAIKQKLILKKIEVKLNSNILSKYEFVYNNTNSIYSSYSILNEVIEYGIGNERLNSTVFGYQTPDIVSFEQKTYVTTESISHQAKIVPGDYNGDGKADLVCLPTSDASWTGMRVYFSDGQDNFYLAFTETPSINMTELEDIRSLDINGDGLDDLLYEYNCSGTSAFNYKLSNGTSFGSPVLFSSQVWNSYTGLSGKKKRKLDKQENDNEISGADYNGDGINDIFLNDSAGNWRIMSFTNSSNELTSTLTTKAYGTNTSLASQVITDDFNGDGIADIWSIDGSGLRIFTYTGNNTLTQIYYTTAITTSHYFTFGDFNGDGKTDLFVYGKIGDSSSDWSYWQVWLSTGTDFERVDIPYKKSSLMSDYLRAADFNGDGATDLMVTSADDSWTGSIFYIAKSTGHDFYSYSLPNYPIASHNFYLSDFNGDGRTDFICTDGKSPWWDGFQLYRSGTKNNILLEKIANGLNQHINISYSCLSQYGAPYTKGSGANFPVLDFQGPLRAVNTVWSDNGIGGQNAITYTYEGAKIHRRGKGFLCYSKVTAFDAASATQTETMSGYDNTYFYPQISTVNQKNGLITTGTTSNTWANKILDSSTKRIFPYVSSSTQINSLTSHSITTAASYDDYGNPTQTVKTYSNGVSETVNNVYPASLLDVTNWLVGRLGSSTVTYAKSGETSISHSVRYTYGSDGITKPDYIYYNEGTPLDRYENYDYDSKGNLVQLYKSGSSIGSTQSNFTYDSNGMNLLTSTDPLGHVETNTYDMYGRLSTETDYLGNTNTYQYDAFGHQTSVSHADGSQTTTSYLWTGTNKPALSLYGISTSNNDGSGSVVWYDNLQRAIRSEMKSFDGTRILKDIEFNAKGQTYRSSDPYFAGGSATWAETYTYDDFGRTTDIVRNSGGNTSYAYNNATVTETTAGKTFSKTYGPDKTLTTAIDNGGTISYAYYPDGKVKTITAPGNAITSIQYDDADRNQTQLSDPSAGLLSYTYDANGKVKTQTDACARLTTNNYYEDGRINTTVTPEGTTTYSYNGNKQLSGVSSPGNVSRTYGYDNKGRVINESENIAGVNFTTTFAYDAYGRLLTRSHPSGISETMNYNGNGYLSSISVGGTTLYTVTGMNARQQLTSAMYGSGLGASYGFDSFGLPTYTKAQAGSSNVQDYEYSFNAVTGNLNSRQNFLRNLSETFTYDNLDRLQTVSGPQSQTISYDDKGNISTKSDVGSTAFVYGSTNRPYALTGVTSTSDLIPIALQGASYTSFEKVDTISENGYRASFLYNSGNDRARMLVSQDGNVILTRWYSGSSFMQETDGSTTRQYTYIGGDAYTAPVVAVTQGGNTAYYYLLRDYLGNTTHLVNASNTVVSEYSFDAWGRRRSADDWSYTLDSNDAELFAGRGYTGHEYLSWFNLVNMNGRLYDPLVGRFLSVDPYVQMPDFTQNLNRYSYCINNPLKYADLTGEFFLGTYLTFVGDLLKTAFIDGGLDPTSKSARQKAWKDFDPTASWSPTNKAWKIDVGGFKTDPNRNFWGRSWQLISRWTWELPQTVIGKGYSHIRNMTGNVDDVSYYGGATLVNKNDNSGWRWGLTLGPYINSKNVVANPYKDGLFRHEFGHTLQSRLVGPLYLTHVGIPSFIGSGLENLGLNDHNKEWYETQANRMSERYFRNHDSGALTALPWDDNEYPRNYNPNWFWLFSHPPVSFMWWLFF